MKIQNTALFFLCALLMLGASCNKTDKNPQTAPYIVASPSSYSMVTGEKKQLNIETFPHVDVSTLQISSDNTAVAEVDGTGLITAIGVGEATITITAASAVLSATCEISVVEVADLTNNGTANCYIISEPGAYKFKAVKGNNPAAVAERVDTAVVLWKSFNTASAPAENELIDHVFTNGNEIVLVTQADKFENGNALIAAEDSEGTILWSWHIWFVEDYEPFASSVICKNVVGRIMDRNLGATRAELTTSYGTYGPYQTYGLIYQWGRKDPFLGSKGAYAGMAGETKTYYQVASTMGTNWPSAMPSNDSYGAIEYATMHPTTWICSAGGAANSHNWLHVADMSLWGVTKTQYDPCPPGWKVPTGGSYGFFAVAAGAETFSFESSLLEGGHNIASKLADNSSDKLYFPYNGKKYGGSGMYLYQVGREKGSGNWWTVTSDGNEAIYAVKLQSNDDEGHSAKLYLKDYANDLATGMAVRCVSEN